MYNLLIKYNRLQFHKTAGGWGSGEFAEEDRGFHQPLGISGGNRTRFEAGPRRRAEVVWIFSEDYSVISPNLAGHMTNIRKKKNRCGSCQRLSNFYGIRRFPDLRIIINKGM
jgi:hypothetical protein